jgi:NAD dependent epimerase/dehydratase
MNTWQGKQVLVTGAGGFIGSHLAEDLVGRGAKVRALVHYNALGSWGWLDVSRHVSAMEVVAGDITDRECAASITEGVDVVFHLAALIAIPFSYCAPSSYVRTNVEGTLNLLLAARDCGVRRFIQTSTSEVYGTARMVPIAESHPLQGQSPYAATKIGADKMAEAFHLSFEVPVVTVRPFNTFGPRQSARAVIPTIIAQVLADRPVHLGSLHPTRDFNFVRNTVEGFVAAASVDAAVGRTLNLGSGREISVGGVAELIGELIGKRIEIVSDNARIRPEASEVERLLADASLARELLGWKPTVSLEEGLRTTIDWARAHPKSYRSDRYTI